MHPILHKELSCVWKKSILVLLSFATCVFLWDTSTSLFVEAVHRPHAKFLKLERYGQFHWRVSTVRCAAHGLVTDLSKRKKTEAPPSTATQKSPFGKGPRDLCCEPFWRNEIESFLVLKTPGYPVILRIFQGFDPFIAPPGTHRVEKSTLSTPRAVGARKACWAKGSFWKDWRFRPTAGLLHV